LRNLLPLFLRMRIRKLQNFSTFNFNFRQPQAVADRITHAKVTTRGREDIAAQIVAEITRPGTVLLLR